MSRSPTPTLARAPWEAIIASASDAIVTLDDERRIVLFNASAERMFRCTAADVIGEPLDRFVPAAVRERHAGFIRTFGETSVSARAMGRDATLTALRADGSEFEMEAQISQTTVDGRRLYTVILRDVSERQRLDDAQARLAAIVASSDDAIVGKNLDGIITDWNPAAERIFGYTREEMIGKAILMLLPPERHYEEADILATLRRGERIDHFETVRVRKDGSRIDVSISVSPIKDSRGRIIGAAKIARDVTDRKRIEAEREHLLASERAARSLAEETVRAKDEFLSVVSHELRTPLAAMLGWVAVLRQGKLPPERVARALETIERNGRLQSELIEDLLDVSRMVTGRLRLETGPTNLRTVIQAALEGVRPEAVAAGIQLSARLEVDALVAGDDVRLQQVVSNILANAVKFTPRDGRIDVRLERAAAEARIVVADSGRGIAPGFLPHVFEPFRQADDVHTRKAAGLGLGLAIVRHLVEAHGGHVRAESAGEDRGTTFTVTLPLLLDASDARPRRDEVPRLDGLRVLLVEDDDESRDALRAVLEERGAIVTLAASAADARAHLLGDEPDVLVSDIRLPGDDGYRLVREVRRTARLRDVPAVALTAYHTEESSERALAAGFHAHFGKPLDLDGLVGAIAELAARHTT